MCWIALPFLIGSQMYSPCPTLFPKVKHGLCNDESALLPFPDTEIIITHTILPRTWSNTFLKNRGKKCLSRPSAIREEVSFLRQSISISSFGGGEREKTLFVSPPLPVLPSKNSRVFPFLSVVWLWLIRGKKARELKGKRKTWEKYIFWSCSCKLGSIFWKPTKESD